jgi:hypothetical protein
VNYFRIESREYRKQPWKGDGKRLSGAGEAVKREMVGAVGFESAPKRGFYNLQSSNRRF